MCGIVVYYGDAENRLTRVLSGMWAIIYRAPDSTGIGLIGSDLETLKIRRHLGSVENLIDGLMESPVFKEGELRVVSVLDDDFHSYSDFIIKNQKKLLVFEGFSSKSRLPYLRWSELTDIRNALALEPGAAGNPEIQEYFKIDSPQKFKAVIQRLVIDFDLPLAVVEKLMRRGFEAQIHNILKKGDSRVEENDLIHEFRQIFDSYAYEEALSHPERLEHKPGQKNPYTRKYVWKVLKDTVVTLPSDYTVDGIANLFRSIDSSVLAASINNPEIDDKIQLIFENFWSINKTTPAVNWRTLYRTERIYNVYGIAAASALAYFQTEVYMKNIIKTTSEKKLPPGHILGRTHPLLLKSMVQPVLAQGRWAVQASVTVRNAHPFVDEKKMRAVVLNGQFSSDIESKIKKYLSEVAGISLRSENSTEFLAMLWGYYFDTVTLANKRYQIIETQQKMGLEDLAVCSQSVDYSVFNKLRNKTVSQIDEMTFIQAVEAMITAGGQFAVSGISIASPDRLFIAAHKRPIYIVKRLDNSDYMVVSDINAALGLFPQTLIQSTNVKLRRLMDEYAKKSIIVEPDFFDEAPEQGSSWFAREKMRLLAPFKVDVYALNQEKIFAKLVTKAEGNNIVRQLEIRDFTGKKMSDIQPDQTYLTPIAFKKDFGKSFYEEHLFEIPDLLRDMLQRHIDPNYGIPRFEISERILKRRFGSKLESLNRLILVGTGSNYLMAELVEKNMEQFLSNINIIIATPGEIDNVDTSINSDRDLVIIVGWSGTSSEIVDFASLLFQKNILMIAITEKPFSDLALIARKSCGVIPVLSGEEVVVAAVKSSICILFTIELFCIYIGIKTGQNKKWKSLVKKMEQVPKKIEDLLNDEKVISFCQDVSMQHNQSYIHYIVDALHNAGSGRAGAFNLELNTWTSMGKAMDYTELDSNIAALAEKNDLMLVNATNTQRIGQALDVMKNLNDRNRIFYCITYKNREKAEIIKYAEQAVFLPKTLDCLQPLIDLTFIYLFGFYFGLARGRLTDEMPRNITKSVTAGRRESSNEIQTADILDDLRAKNSVYSTLPAGSFSIHKKPCWIESAQENQDQTYYTDLIKLCSIFQGKDSFLYFFISSKNRFKELSDLIFRHLADDGMIILVPMDKSAEAGCRNFIKLWEPFLELPLQVEFPEKIKGVSTEASLVVIVACEPPDQELLDIVTKYSHENLVWIGPENRKSIFKFFEKSYGSYILANLDLTCKEDHIYFALSLFFLKIMEVEFLERSKLLNSHFQLALPVINRILDDQNLKDEIRQVVAENKTYRKIVFITGLKGNCISWEKKFGSNKNRVIKSTNFGVSAGSHLVMVDPDIEKKYIQLEPRYKMEEQYQVEDLDQWEKRFLGGLSIDMFIEKPYMPFKIDSVLPFMVDDQWFLPVLKKEYDTNQDCLVIIDATSERSFDSALDELATFGSRYARLVIITQKAFAADTRLTTLKKSPLSHIIMIPECSSSDYKKSGAVSEYLLPLILNIIGHAMSLTGG
ncbi:MAG: SIS domain-containing protein [Deltaproteobacteria bacterium]|jgi:glucosamine 6-phosphate synthetase-like amidotransferase/phosphosugar isomerase protein|nr:SIS domain-containing protein [Deltaproteobacteria bacterium]